MTDLTSYRQLILVKTLPLDQHPVTIYLASLTSEHSRRTMRQALDVIAALLAGADVDAFRLDWTQLRYLHTAVIRIRLSELYKPATTNKMLSALRGVLKEAWQLGYLSAEDYHRAINVKGIKAETLPAGRELSSGELQALLMACNQDQSPAGVRDGAIIATLYTGGLRRAELAMLNLEDYESDTGKMLVRQGKGRKERLIYLPSSAQTYLHRWLALRGGELGALLYPINKGGIIQRRRMTDQAIYDILQKRAEIAGVKAFTPHDLRRTFVSDLLEAGADIAVVSKLAGHTNIQTTARYDRRPEQAKRRAASLLHVPEPE